MKQLVLDLIAAPAPSFENFAVGRNAEALRAVTALLDSQPAHRLVYLWGAPTSGKSHIAEAVVNSGRGANRSFGAEVADVAGIPTTVVDDAQLLTDQRQVALFNDINSLAAEPHRRLLVTGDVAPRDLPLRPELTSRLGSGLVFQLHPLSDDEKQGALQAHAKSRGFKLREEVAHYLLRHSRRDMRSLTETLNALDQYSLETGREITLPLIREMSQPVLIA